MRTTARQRLDNARSVLRFCRQYPASDRATVAAVLCLQHILDQVGTLLRSRLTAQQDAVAARDDSKAMAMSLKGLLSELVRQARIVAMRERLPDARISIAFRMSSEESLTEAVQSALAVASRHEVLLLEHGMPQTLLPALQEGLDRYLAAVEQYARARQALGAATRDIRRLAHPAMLVMRRLDHLNRIRFRGDRARLAEWESALNGRWGVKLAG